MNVSSKELSYPCLSLPILHDNLSLEDEALKYLQFDINAISLLLKSETVSQEMIDCLYDENLLQNIQKNADLKNVLVDFFNDHADLLQKQPVLACLSTGLKLINKYSPQCHHPLLLLNLFNIEYKTLNFPRLPPFIDDENVLDLIIYLKTVTAHSFTIFQLAENLKVLYKIQRSPLAQDLLLIYLQENEDLIKNYSSLSYLHQSLISLKNYPYPFKLEKNFLAILMFMNRYKEKFKGVIWGKIPYKSPTLRKIKIYAENLIQPAERLKIVGYEILKAEGRKKIEQDQLQDETAKDEIDKKEIYTIQFDPQKGTFTEIKVYLNNGVFKKINKVFDFSTLEIKAVSKQRVTADVQADIEREIKLLNEYKGIPHVLQIHSTSQYRSHLKNATIQKITAHFYNRDNLSVYKDHLTDDQKLQVMVEVVEGVLQLHNKGIVHRDLKPENILIEKNLLAAGEEQIQAVVGDLGFACQVEDKAYLHTQRGSLLYMARELLLDLQYADFITDSWSVGIIISQLFKDKIIIGDTVETKEQLIAAVTDFQCKPAPPDEKSLDYLIWALVRAERSKRLTLDKALVILKEIQQLNI